MKLDIAAGKAAYREHRKSQPTYKERLAAIRKKQAEKELLKLQRPKEVTVLCVLLTGVMLIAFSWPGFIIGWLISVVIYSRYR